MAVLLNKIWGLICSFTISGIGKGIASTGIVVKELTVILIMFI